MKRGRRVRTRRRTPQAHWWLLGLVLVSLLAALGLQDLSSGLGAPTTPDAQPQAAQVPGGGAVVLRDSEDRLASRRLPARTVALTFDDGPDPRWTPAVTEVLDREGVPGTFFVLGANAAEHGGIVRDLVRGGHEVGHHTWSHADLTSASAPRRNLELSLGQLGLAGAGHIRTPLIRPPYSSTPEAVTTRDLRMLEQVTDAGYVVVLSDVDTKDWQRAGTESIVRAGAPPADGSGALVLLHDGGGERSQTVAALPALIQAYRDAGYRFTTVSGGLGLDPGAVNEPVSGLRLLQGQAVLLALDVSTGLVRVLPWLLLPLLALSLLRTAAVVLVSRRHVRLAQRRRSGPAFTPPVSVLVPAYNEAVGIAQAVRSLVASDYPVLEVVVVDDGSTDGTADVVEALGLPGVVVHRQANAGKAGALRTGTALASHDVLVMLDGDTVFEADTIRHMVQPLSDPRVGAVSGNVKVGNRQGLLGRWQHLEYVAGFNLDRRLLDVLRCITTVPGAAGAFRRQAVVAAGGLSDDTLAEDTDITMGILRAGYEVVHEERARAWTEAPSTLRDLWKQRYRWAYGTLQVVWKHRRALVSGGDSARLGRIALPALVVLQVLLPLLAPVIDVFALHGLMTGEGRTVALTWGGYALLQVVLTGYALRLDGESLRPLWSLPLQQVVYRQLIYLVVIQSVVSALRGVRLPWHKLERTGQVTVTP